MMLRRALLAACLASAASAQGLMGRRFRDYLVKENKLASQPVADYEDVEELYFTQVLDHFDASSKVTYQQRYFTTSRYLHESSSSTKNIGCRCGEDKLGCDCGKTIVFLCVGGEGPGFDKSVLLDSVHCSGDMIALAQMLFERGFIIHTYALEHRYYGKSYPDFGDESPLETKNLKYLSSRQSLEDLAHFVQTTTQKICSDGDCDEKDVQWITFGGSYPGYLAGMARYKYPHLIYAAVSNSAPLELKVDFPEYKTRVGWDLKYKKVGGSDECHDIIKEGHAQAANAPPTELAKMFKVCNAETALLQKNNIGMLIGDGLIDVPAQVNDPSCGGENGDRLGKKWRWCDTFPCKHHPKPRPRPVQDSLCNIERLCNAVVSTKQGSNITALEVLSKIADRQFRELGGASSSMGDDNDCINVDWNEMLDVLSDTTIEPFGTRSWLWQTCTEVGFYQTCEKDCPFGNNFHLIDMDMEICKVAYGISQEQVYANVQSTLDHYGGLDISGGSRILSVNGDVDPWSVLGLHTSPKYSLPVEMVAGASHHFWTHVVKETDAQEIKDIRTVIYSTVMDWLDIDEKNFVSVDR